ncbi:D-amino acid dehydrogenase [Vibrio sp. CAU 1672]|uniref:D-amino acid dehydrogenase n=1 Tax=Vibrio sp. CAU 1672 TaxID=3032594 RepID=UPI0023DB33AE|nr:D-amino acid dehydrogenase [Vibrio sp. CAU 1672]MDF2155031.1 D-amino acid dehydrogenase [Vibrio sp. CAU 1672]
MEVIVLGSGVIGLTSAWYLSKAGYQVTVIDRQPDSALETSFANAGQISYGYSSPWAAPGIPLKALKWLTEEHAPLKIKPTLSSDLIRWASQMVANCTLSRYQVNKARMLAIANHSRVCLEQLRQEHAISYQGRQLGTLQVFRSEQQLDAIKKDMQLLEQSGTRFQLMDVQQCLEQEPALALVADKLVGGLYLPDDETGDCHLFCQQLTELAKTHDVRFEFGTEVTNWVTAGKKVTGVQTNRGLFNADQFVVAAGSYSTALLGQLDIRLPVYPVKGYSLTVPIENQQYAPRSTVMDETYKVALTRFDDRIRVAGTAELAGFDPSLPQKRTNTIEMVLRDLFPRSADFSQSEFWTGFRPMTPDGTPIIGQTPYQNLFTNTGHGTLGWTMACGSGHLLADLMAGSTPLVSAPAEFSLSRYQRA